MKSAFLSHLPKGISLLWMTLATCLLGGVGWLAWAFVPCEFHSAGEASLDADLMVPFDEFRTLLVRDNPSKSIVEHGGMQLVDEETLDVQVDLSNDRRPLINALRRKSKSTVQAQKRLTISVENAEIGPTRLVLIQDIQISPEQVEIVSESVEPSGELTFYRTTLQALPNGDSTKIHVSVEIELNKKLSWLLHAQARSRLNIAAKDSANEQVEAIREFAMQHAQRLTSTKVDSVSAR